MRSVFRALSIVLRLLIVADVVARGHPAILLSLLVYGALTRYQVFPLNYIWVVLPLYWSRGCGTYPVVLLIALALAGAARQFYAHDPDKRTVRLFFVFRFIAGSVDYLFTSSVGVFFVGREVLREHLIAGILRDASAFPVAMAAGAQRRGWDRLSLILVRPALVIARWAGDVAAEGHGLHLRGIFKDAAGDWNGCMVDLSRAEQLFIQAGPDHIESLERVRGDIRQVMGGNSDSPASVVPSMRLDADSPIHGEHLRMIATEMRERGDLAAARAMLVEARAILVKQRRTELLVKRLDAELVHVDMELGTVPPVDAAARLHEIARYLDRFGQAGDALELSVWEADCHARNGDLSRAERLLVDLRGTADRRGDVAAGQVVAARLIGLYENVNPRLALEHCVDAIAILEEQRYRRSSVLGRAALTDELLPIQGRAMRLAYQTREWGLLVELIESCRLQASPSGGSAAKLDTSRSGRLLDLQLNERVYVSVNGRSWLAERARPGKKDVVRVIAIEDVIAAIDSDGIWWSAWFADAASFWALVTSRGVLDVGFDEMVDDRTIADILQQLTDALAGNVDWSRIDELTRTSAARLLPEQLRLRLVQRARARSAGSDTPLRLLLALPPLMAHLPVILMPIDLSGERLIEGAVCQVVPPVAQLAHFPDGLPAGDEFPIRLAVVDPTDQLKYARRAPAGAEHVLRGADATVGNTIRALGTLGNRCNALFYFAGHFSLGSDGPLDSGPVLADGVLTARVVYEQLADPSGIRMPRRLQISACSSLANTGAWGIDWTGFAAASLAAGATDIIATSWNLPDEALTTEADHLISAMLCSDPDPARGLRDIQVGYLNRWREDPRGRDAPKIWAAYQYLGMPRRPTIQ
jgi:hypothetical protein